MGGVYEQLWPDPEKGEAVSRLTTARLYEAYREACGLLRTYGAQRQDLQVTFQADENVAVLDDDEGDFSPMDYTYEPQDSQSDMPAYQMLYGVVEKFSLEPDENQNMVLYARVTGGDLEYREIYKVCIAKEGDTAPHRTRIHSVVEPTLAREGYLGDDGERADTWKRYGELLTGVFGGDLEKGLSGQEFLKMIRHLRRRGMIGDVDECATAFNLALNNGGDLLLDSTVSGAINLIEPGAGPEVPAEIAVVSQKELEVIGFALREAKEKDAVRGWMYCYDPETSWIVRVSLHWADVLLYFPPAGTDRSGF